MKYKVIDIAIPEEGGSEGIFSGTKEECEKFVKDQGGIGFEIVSDVLEKIEAKQCKFILAWAGRCKKESNESGYCAEHEKEICCSCGKKATRQCAETMGLVCGAPLCDECEHTIWSNGCNSCGFDANAILPEGLGTHCKKSEQKYEPWYKQEGRIRMKKKVDLDSKEELK